MYKGVQLYTVRDYLGDKAQFEETLLKIKKIGYDCVQMGTPSYMKAEETKAYIDSIGIKSCSAYADFETLVKDPAAIKTAIKEAKIYETDLIGVGTLPVEMRDSREGFERYVKKRTS